VGQDEDAEPLVGRADFCRAEQARRRRVAHVPKLSQDGLKTEGDVPGDVFEEDPLGAAFADDTGNIWPEVAGIVCATALSGGAERLAGISCQNVPDWCGREISCALGGDEDTAGPVLPFDKCAGVETGFGQHEAHIQASAACAEGQSVPGT
jgi:hypothetical protein